MALNDDDKKEIAGLIPGVMQKALGLEEGKTLADVIAKIAADTTNAVVNAYDKRSTKEREKELAKSLGLEEGQTFADMLDKRLKAAGTELPKGSDGKVDLSKLPEPVREMLAQQNARFEELTQSLDKEKKAREKEQGERQKIEAERAQTQMRDAIRKAALDKDSLGGRNFDPEMADVLIEHLGGKVRKVEGKDAYEFQTGIDAITQSAVFKPLVEGLKEFGASTLGKRFRPAQPGGGAPPGGGGGGGGGGTIPLTIEQLGTMKPSEIAAAAEGSKFTSQ